MTSNAAQKKPGFLFLIAILVQSLVFSPTAFAQLPSNNPDDYDLEKYERELQQERERLRPLRENLKRAQDQLERDQAKVRDLKSKVDSAKANLDRAQDALKSVKDQQRGLEDTRRALRQQIDAAKAGLDRAQNEVRDARQAVQQAEARIAPVKDKLQAAQADLQREQEKVRATENDVRAAAQEVQKEEREGERLQREIDDVKRKMAEEDQKDRDEDARDDAEDRADDAKPADPANPDAGKEKERRKRERRERRENRKRDRERGPKKSLEERLRQLEQRKAQNDQQIAQARQKLAQAEAVKAQAQQGVERAERELAGIRASIGNAEAELQAARNRAQQAERQVDTLRAEVSSKESQLENTKNQEQQLRAREQQEENNVQSARNELQGAQGALPGAQAELDRSRDQAQAAKNQVEQAQRGEERAQNRVEQVRRNIEQGRRHFEELGREHGSRDGERGGAEEARQQGQAAGADQGRDDGNREGTQESIRRAEARGQDEGVRVGNDAGARDGERQGGVDGARDGLSEGTAEGLQQAYRRGYDVGYDDGQNTGRDTQAYQQGEAKGLARGLQDAIDEAKPLEKKSYDTTEAGYLQAQLKSVNLGDEVLSQGFKGLQDRAEKRRGDRRGPRDGRRGFDRHDGGMPHQRFRADYDQAYDRAFESAFRDSYNRVYDVEFDRAYDQAYSVAFGNAAAQPQNDVYRRSYEDAYAGAYRATYQRRYNDVYRAEKSIAFDNAVAANRNDAGRIAKGTADGVRQGSYDRGFKIGRDNAYRANIEGEKAKSIAKGKAAADSYYQNNAVLLFESVELFDADGDKFNRPGEAVDVLIKLKNFGLKPGAGVREGYVGNDALAISSAQISTEALPGQSQIQILRRAKIAVKPTTKDGAKAKLIFEMTDGARTLGKKSFDFVAQYPVESSVEGLKATLAPGAKQKFKIVLRNRAATPQKVTLTLDSDAAIVKSSVAKTSVVELKKAETKTITGEFTALESGFLLKSPITVTTQKDGVAWATSYEGAISVAKKYKLSDKSKSFLISSGETARGTSVLYQSGGVDVWDYRVDTNRMDGSTVGKYVGKIVQVIADGGLTLETDVAQALKRHFTKGGTLVIWGDRVGDSRDVTTLLQSVGVNVGRAEGFEGALQGVGVFSDLGSPLKGSVATVDDGASLRGQALLKAGEREVALMSFQGAMKTTYGRVFVIAANPAELGTDVVKKILSRVEALSLSFEKKLAGLKADPKGLALVMSDIRDEVVEAELDEKPLYYKDFGGNNRIQRVIEKVLFDKATGAQLKEALVDYYPYVIGLVNSLTKEKPYAQKVVDLKTKASPKTWKQLYCEGHVGTPVCQ